MGDVRLFEVLILITTLLKGGVMSGMLKEEGGRSLQQVVDDEDGDDDGLFPLESAPEMNLQRGNNGDDETAKGRAVFDLRHTLDPLSYFSRKCNADLYSSPSVIMHKARPRSLGGR